MSHRELKRKAAPGSRAGEPPSAKRPRRGIEPELDHRYWGLDLDQRAQVLRLYKEGIALTAKQRSIKQEIWGRRKNLLDDNHTGEGLSDSDEGVSYCAEYSSDESPYCSDAYYSVDSDACQVFMESRSCREHREQLMDEDADLECLVEKWTSNNSKIQQVATECADLQLCSPFITMICNRLPRELRDQIYDCLWTAEDVLQMDGEISAFSMTSDETRAIMAVTDLPVPRYANADLVGHQFAAEAAEWYLRMRKEAEVDYRCVRAYLERDRFGPMPLFIRNCIRRLIIKIDCQASLITGMDYEALRDSMDSLLMLKDHDDLAIEIYLDQGLQYHLAFYRVLEIIKSAYLVLREANLDIKVLGWEFFSPVGNDPCDVESEQLNYYFTGTPKEWLDMKAEEIKAIKERKLRIQCQRILRIMQGNLASFMRST
ncbi:hypothetical protein BDW02DRAFT_573931 [Decorospora gaudefroyi]|uniref:Uncharacterized protein n=1 Tax=Decorospora gaudefroyi TaxID=184978 RepID=A0A6A5JXD0_9PLEO|nr:hypothetical protein BDW02DRAFT_573931 [Decorospora gaudefroyi]